MSPLGTRPRRSPFAPEVLPDGRRRFSHEAVVARRVLLAGVLAAGVGGGVVLSRLSGDDTGAVTTTDGSAPAGAVAAAPAVGAPAAEQGPSRTAADSPWVVVNKQHPLDPVDYAPTLAVVDGKEVAAVIAPDLRALLQDAGRDGVSLSVTSGYRSYQRQTSVHDNAVARDGLESAESVSARPGYSEHQTGLAVDFGGRTQPGCLLKNCFGQTPESEWLRAHAGRYGFLLRYPEGKTDVTGYDPEPWHWRWVGEDLVRQVTGSGVATLEEFFGISGGPEYA
ncbi:M15 family metallopeptidase [Kineococcus sp. NPDC059986]|jgi:D-alanyl-D-alanine carboxypeptidase|uniref:M15 family metallopeptidase n=1 Tax=Kineococcus sp. NPDC059986 TaxID=3155538 RepID=UPI00344D7911